MEKRQLLHGYMLVPISGFAASMFGIYPKGESEHNVVLFDTHERAEVAKGEMKYSIACNLKVHRVEIKDY